MTRVLHGAIRHGHILGFSGVGPRDHVAIACRGDDAEREVWESTTDADVESARAKEPS